jgi:hypothetical protein
MRTTRSTVTFHQAFVLNVDSGELPAGSYDIEIDEDEISTAERTAYRRAAVYFYVQDRRSTRTLVVDPRDLESALRRDTENALRSVDAKSAPAISHEVGLP